MKKTIAIALVLALATGLSAATRADVYAALKSRNLAKAKALLAGGVNVNEPDKYGNTLINDASEGHFGEESKEMIPAVQVLLDAGADVNHMSGMHKNTPLTHSLESFIYNDLARYLVDHKADLNLVDKRGMFSLCIVLERHYNGFKFDFFKYLLDHGADVNGTSADGMASLHWLAHRDLSNPEYAKALDYVVSKGADVNKGTDTGVTPLHLAAFDGNDAFIKTLLSKGADVNARNKTGETPLLYYGKSHEPNHKAAELLIKGGADVNAVTKRSETALTFPALCGNCGDKAVKVVELLIRNGANPDLRLEGGKTLLEQAMANGRPEIIGPLLKNTKMLNTPNEKQETFLHTAVIFQKMSVVKLLVEAGADLNAENRYGMTALKMAEGNNFTEIAQYLRSKGAK